MVAYPLAVHLAASPEENLRRLEAKKGEDN